MPWRLSQPATTCHSYTNDPKIHDIVHKDPRRARAAEPTAVAFTPTTTMRPLRYRKNRVTLWAKTANHPMDLKETVTAYEFRKTEKQQEQSTKL